jgi:predicted metal-dependent phosphoesterase TrpH
MLKIDMHVHTWYSDSTASVDDVLNVARRKNLDGLAITDHHTLHGAREAQRKSRGLIIIPGEEIKTTNGEILALGLTRPIPKNLSINETLKRVRFQGGLAIIPHPTLPLFSKLKVNDLEHLSIDGLEAISAATPLPQYFLKKNLELAKNLNLPIIAGSDSHFPETVGNEYTLVNSETRELDDILHAIKLGRTSIRGELSGVNLQLKMLIGMLRHLLECSFNRE